MSKSVYSIVLSDEVVAMLDREAYKNGTNRSSMINRILAEYVSYMTPEKKMQTVFSTLGDILGKGDTFRLVPGGASLLSLNSALVYKYNPSVRYSVELYRNRQDAAGELRVYMRTQNSALILTLLDFYRLWSANERMMIGESDSMIDESARFVRLIKPRINVNGSGELRPETLGEVIAEYIRAFDAALKAYFYNCNDQNAARNEVGRIYRSYLSSAAVII